MKIYKTILADCPWQYRNKQTGYSFKGSLVSGSASKYPTLSLNELKQLPIPSISHKDSVLFLWATTPLLPEVIELMQSWKFHYKTAIYWRKIMSLGMGFWFRGQVELCLLGVRGKVKAFRCQHPNFIQSKVRKHSQKPEEFFELIEPVCPSPRIELFARSRRPGWDSWGLEVENDIEL